MRDAVGMMRMQNIDRLFSSLPRLLRDISIELGKEIELLIDGSEVVLGRSDPDARLARFAPLLPRLAAQHPGQRLARADLRYTNGFSLTWADLPKAAPAAMPLPQPVDAQSRDGSSPTEGTT